MDYIKIRFGSNLEQLEANFAKTVEEMFCSLNPMFRFTEERWKPQMDIYETPDDIYILAEIAGVKKEDLEIEINSKAIRIYGSRYELPRMKNATYRLAEIQYGRFERILYLPSPIDTDKVTATYLEGFLKIQLTKLPQEKRCKIYISEK